MNRKSFALVCLLLAVMACSCTDSDESPAVGEPDEAGGAGGVPNSSDLGALCDGSDHVRWGVTLHGGDDPGIEDAFTNPNGRGFVFVTGRCDFYVSTAYYSGTFTGHMTASEARTFEASVGWQEAATWGELDAGMDCPDWDTRIHIPGMSTICSCECGADQPETKASAFDDAWDLIAEMEGAGVPLNGPVSVLLVEVTDTPSADVVDFPFDWDPAERAMTHDEVRGASVDELGFLIEDADEAAQFRALARDRAEPYRPLYLKTQNDEYFEAFVVDPLPPGVASAVDAFLER